MPPGPNPNPDGANPNPNPNQVPYWTCRTARERRFRVAAVRRPPPPCPTFDTPTPNQSLRVAIRPQTSGRPVRGRKRAA